MTSFLLKLAEVIGLAPALDACASCGRQAESLRFSFGAGGAVCDNCRTDGAVRLRAGLTDYLARLASADLSELPEPDMRFSGEAMGIARRFVEYHLERRLSSLAVLDE
jgi:DNA repair protein RecO (recombination protein O)